MQIRQVVLSLALLLSTDLAVRASSPVLNNIMPRGVQRAKEEVLIFQGARLSDAKEVLFYSAGVTVKNLKVLKDDSVQVTVQVAADCRLGEHAVRLRTGTGISELRTFFVGALPVVAEKEPNNEFANPQKIPLNVTVTGVIDSEDVDYFAVEAKKGQRITAEIEGMRLGNTLFDPCISILNSKRFELAVSDDTPLLGQDGLASILAPEDGTYIIQVRESSYGGNGACHYRLHIGTFPRPLAVLPAGGKLGEKIEVRYLGDLAGEKKATVQLPASPVERFGVFAQDDQGIAPSGLPFRLSEFGNVMEVEPNDELAKATPVPSLPMALNGVIEKPGDMDHFRFKMKKGEVYDFHCYARRLGSPLDPVLLLMNSKGGGLIANDDSGGPDSYFRYQAPADDDYILRVDDHLKKGGPTYVYRIEITPVKPTMSLSIPKVALYSQDRQTVAVPRGNRFAVLMNVARADFGGELVMGADKLPQGMTASAENMMPYLDTIPMVFEAAADAPAAGNMAIPFAKHVDPKQTISSRFNQMLELVYGPPGQSVYWTETEHQLACAVTEEAPFKIRIVEPKVPLVHNGSINLKIVAERKKGYNDAITIIALWNPPGVGSVGSAVIPAGQTETLYAMNANGGAPVRKWKYVVLAVANVGNGPIWVASQPATIEIAPPFVALQMERASAEQGKSTDLFCKVQVQTPFEGSAKMDLIGLPPKVTTQPVQITKDTKEVSFKLNLDKASPPGVHKNLFCQLTINKTGEPVVHNLGSSELRIDVPIIKAAAPAPAQVAAKQPEPAKAAAPAKRLSHLEQLRLDQEEREKAAAKK
jgi:hypothetical protein